MSAKRDGVHVDAAHEITMPELNPETLQVHSDPWVWLATALRTMAGRSPFRATEARDAGLLALVLR